MSVWIIISGIVAVMLTGLSLYITMPILFSLYSSDDVQTLTGAAKFAADTNYQIFSVMGMLFVAAIFINMYSRVTTKASSGFLD